VNLRNREGNEPRASAWLRFLQAGILPRLVVILIGAPSLYIITRRGGLFFLALMNLIILLGLREFYGLLVIKGYRPYRAIGTACGLALTWYVYWGKVEISLLLTLTLLLIMVLELGRREVSHSLNHIAMTMLGVLYVGWLGSHLIMLRELPTVARVPDVIGAHLVFFVAMVTWAGDIVAYLVGIAFGAHPLLPLISPKKTIEGALGGLLGSSATGLWCATGFAAAYLTPAAGLLLGLAGGICGQLGDLVESLLKRDVGIKDTAGLIPGHGGILDRFDSLLFSAPLLYYYFRLFVF
jgi:phosphatidate cytidylyltransferase